MIGRVLVYLHPLFESDLKIPANYESLGGHDLREVFRRGTHAALVLDDPPPGWPSYGWRMARGPGDVDSRVRQAIEWRRVGWRGDLEWPAALVDTVPTSGSC